MSTQYTNALPVDRKGQTMQEFATPAVALATSAAENSSVSSVLTLHDNTTTLEVTAVGTTATIKWIAVGNTNPSVITAAGTANFDNAIPANTTRRFSVPVETIGTSSIVGLNKQNGLYNRVAIKSVGVASILTTQY